MQINAYAKINWTLDVIGSREDGYHLLDMLMQQVELHDEIRLQEAENISLSTEGYARVTTSEDNLALRAARKLCACTGIQRGVRIILRKEIPIGAGLGGGSADAAAVLLGLNSLWKLNLPVAKLCEIGLSLGTDVPYCIRGGLMRAQGVGEILTPLDCARQYWMIIVQPCRGLSTKDVFSRFESEKLPPEMRPDNETAIRALAAGDLRALAGAMRNALQPVSEKLRPAICEAVSALRSHGAQAAMMSGSGSAVYGVFINAQTARAAKLSLYKTCPVCFMTHTRLEGNEIPG